MAICNFTEKEIRDWMDVQNELFDYWNSKRSIRDRFHDDNEGYLAHASAKFFNQFAQQKLKMPFTKDLPLKSISTFCLCQLSSSNGSYLSV